MLQFMKKRGIINVLSLAILLLCACNRASKLEGTINSETFNSREIYLLRHDGYELVSTDTAVIRNNRFVFNNLVDGVYYILLEDPSMENEITQVQPLYIAKESVATVCIYENEVIIGGNPEREYHCLIQLCREREICSCGFLGFLERVLFA
jgi:hypothetical protein